MNTKSVTEAFIVRNKKKLLIIAKVVSGAGIPPDTGHYIS
jgi:hypothetical protein